MGRGWLRGVEVEEGVGGVDVGLRGELVECSFESGRHIGRPLLEGVQHRHQNLTRPGLPRDGDSAGADCSA